MILPRKIRSSRRLRDSRSRSEAMTRHPSSAFMAGDPRKVLEDLAANNDERNVLFLNILCAHACGDFKTAVRLTDQGDKLCLWYPQQVDRALLRYDQKNR